MPDFFNVKVTISLLYLMPDDSLESNLQSENRFFANLNLISFSQRTLISLIFVKFHEGEYITGLFNSFQFLKSICV